MPEYMLLLHEDPAEFSALPPEEMQRIVERYRAWSQRVGEAGALVRGVKLRDEGGRHLRRGAGAGGALVTDGPYVEAKEVVGGYFLVRAADYAGAVAIAEGCPHLAHGWIEVREVEPT